MKKKKKQLKERRHFVRSGDITAVTEKRRFMRVEFNDHFSFTECTRNVFTAEASSLNVSQKGILFETQNPPQLNSIIEMTISEDILSKCVTSKKLLHDDNGQILGQVVRVDAIPNVEVFLVGVKFLLKGL